MNISQKKKYLLPTYIFDWDVPIVKRRFEELSEGKSSQEDLARSFFYYVRDEIKYRIFDDDVSIEQFRASTTLKNGYGFCIPKSAVLIALARAAKIPARLHLADIRNHQLPHHIFDRLQTNLMAYHGYTELYLNNKWIGVNPAFDNELCERHDIIPVEFNGRKDALFHKYDKKERLHIEYITDYGTFSDLPYDRIVTIFRNLYKIQ